jgi:hypothetical protein
VALERIRFDRQATFLSIKYGYCARLSRVSSYQFSSKKVRHPETILEIQGHFALNQGLSDSSHCASAENPSIKMHFASVYIK